MSWTPRDGQFVKRNTRLDTPVPALTSQVTISDIQGEAMRSILCRYWIVTVGNPLDFLVLPNGAVGEGISAGWTMTGVLPTRQNFFVSVAQTNVMVSGWFWLDTERRSFNQTNASQLFRRFENYATSTANPPTPTAVIPLQTNGLWTNTGDVLSSIEFRSTTANQPNTLQNGIGAGSYFEIWELR